MQSDGFAPLALTPATQASRLPEHVVKSCALATATEPKKIASVILTAPKKFIDSLPQMTSETGVNDSEFLDCLEARVKACRPLPLLQAQWFKRVRPAVISPGEFLRPYLP